MIMVFFMVINEKLNIIWVFVFLLVGCGCFCCISCGYDSYCVVEKINLVFFLVMVWCLLGFRV